MTQWLDYFLALIQSGINWLSSMQIFGISLLSVIAATIIIPIVFGAILFRVGRS